MSVTVAAAWPSRFASHLRLPCLRASFPIPTHIIPLHGLGNVAMFNGSMPTEEDLAKYAAARRHHVSRPTNCKSIVSVWQWAYICLPVMNFAVDCS